MIAPVKLNSVPKYYLKSGKMYFFLRDDQILNITAKGSRSIIHSSEGEFVVNSSMAYLESVLSASQFFRIHKSHIVNMTKIKKMNLQNQCEVILINGEHVTLSIGRKYFFIKKMTML